jgi:hypothetical protein
MTSITPLSKACLSLQVAADASSTDIRYKSYALECLGDWLQDNVDTESNVHFDKEGLVFSTEVLAAVNCSLLFNLEDVNVLDAALGEFIKSSGDVSPAVKAIAQQLSSRVNGLRDSLLA